MLLWWFAQTTLMAGALAVLATLAARWKRLGPEARHLLWLLVLIKLAIPPLIAWPWAVPDAWPSPARVEPASAPASEALPAPAADVDADAPAIVSLPQDDPRPASTLEEEPGEVEVAGEIPAPAPAEPRSPEVHGSTPPGENQKWENSHVKSEIGNAKFSRIDTNTLLLVVWLAGSAVVVARRVVKVLRFHRALADSRPAPGWLVEEARAIGGRVGVRPPPVVTTPVVATPLLWCLGRPRLIVPEALVGRLGGDRWPGILAHELAHLARGDHWVLRLELLVEAAWWWNPLFWLARRRLREEAENACDARVVRAWPERRYAYAEALVDVCEHIARSSIPRPSPSLGIGAGGAAHSLEGRLNMILRDPIPHRPTRRAAVLAVLLAALSLPAWTLGQQPEPPPSKPVAVPEPPTARPSPPQAAPSVPIDAILAARYKARQGLGNLSFRYVVEDRNQSRTARAAGLVAAMGGMGGGMGGMGGGSGAAGGGFGAPGGPGQGGGRGGQPGTPMMMIRSRSVSFEVADVILGPGTLSRVEVLEARPAPLSPRVLDLTPSARTPAWRRRLVAFDGSGYLTLEMDLDKTGPVPFRWLSAQGRQQGYGDALTSAFHNDGPPSVDPDPGVDPLEPRPRNLLDLNDNSAPFLDPETAQVEVVGLDTIEGREAVRIAWTSRSNDGLRGLCWVAPSLGFAVVGSDATLDPGRNVANQRKSWRKRSSDFVKVADLWLPRKVTYEESDVDPAGGEPIRRHQREMTFEDYKVAPPLSPDTFHPKLAIQALDDTSGHFTTLPPEIPAGLVDRLTLAIRESKFGPPVAERIVEEPKAVATQPNPFQQTPGNRGEQPAAKPGASPAPPNLQLNPNQPDVLRMAPKAQAGRLMVTPGEDPARALKPGDVANVDPKIIANPAAGFQDPIPTVDPPVNDPISARIPTDPDTFLRKPEAVQNKVKAPRAPEEVETSSTDEVALRQARRDGKAAELQKAEAQVSLAKAIVERNARLKAKGAGFVSSEEVAKADAELKLAEADLAGKKAELAEADVLLNQARREVGRRTASASPSSSPQSLADLRDAVELMEVQLQGKQAELRGVDAKANLARRQWEQVKVQVAKHQVSKNEADEYGDKDRVAQAELDAKKAEVLESEVRLKQARRRLETGEARLKREAERAKARLDWSSDMHKKGFAPKSTYDADKAAYDELMIQIDPKYVPAPSDGAQPAKP